MHFPLLSRLSHLIHRRPKSESFAADVLKQLAEELADEDESKPLPHSRSLDSNDGRSPFILPPHLVGVLPQHPIPTSFNDILIVLSNLERRIPLLEDENARLKQEKDKLIFKNQLCEQDINLHKTQAVRQQSYLCKLQHEFQQMQLQQEQKRLEHIPLEDFLIKTLASYPPGHVFRKIAIAIDAGSSFASAIVAVMREEVETSPNSPWSKLVPAIVGPRTSDQYASALSIVLKARKDLRHSQNASRFWKQQAKLEDANADVITPSSSILSDVQESLSEERQRAVNDLLRKLRSGEIPIRSRVVTQAAPAQKSREEASSSSLSSPPQNIESLAAVPDAAPGPPLQDVFEAAPTPLGSAMNTIPDPSSTQDEHRNLFTTLNSIPQSSTIRSLGAPASISSVSSSSVSSFASTEFSELWEIVTPASLSSKLTPFVFKTPSRDTEDIGSFPIPPPRPPRPSPRVSPFSGLETIDEMDEPGSRSSSSNYVSSLPSSSANEAPIDTHTTTVDPPPRNDNQIAAIVDEAQLPMQQTAPPEDLPPHVKQILMSMFGQDVESSVKQQRPQMKAAMSKLPRRLSLSLKRSGKEKEKSKGEESEEETTPDRGKGKAKNTGSMSLPISPPRKLPVLQQRKRVLVVRNNSPIPSVAPPPIPLQFKKPLVPPIVQVKLLSRVRANSNSRASARPTISSTLKQTSSPPKRTLNKEDKENIWNTGPCGSPTKMRMKAMKSGGVADRLGGIKFERVVRRAVV